AAPGTAPRRRQRAGWTPDRPLAVPPAGAEASASIWRAETSASMSGEIGALEGGGRSPAPPAARVEAGAPSPAPPPPRADADVPVVPPPALEPARPRLFAWERQLIAFVSVALEPPVGVIAAQLAPTLGEIIDKLEPFGGRIRDVRPHGVTALFGVEPLDDFARRAANAAVAALKAVQRAAAVPLAELVGRAALHGEERVV